MCYRVVCLVGIKDRQNYLAQLDISSNGTITKNPDFSSQMTMAFWSAFGKRKGAFKSISSQKTQW